MVLFKRKPVHLIPQPTDVPDQAEVYVMKGTGEVFTDYEKYLKRYDYLSQRKFTDAVNGKSNLTYFDAKESETRSKSAIENVFPDVLKDPILRRVQFATISRIDDLVNTVFDEYKHDFFPGEYVTVTTDEGETFQGQIREKAQFPMIRGPDGSVQREAFSRYFVRLNDSDKGQEVLSDGIHTWRDKKMFTKQNLRAFLKNSLQREGWVGAPWLVKEYLAIAYRLPMEIPAHLLQDAKLLANKQQALLKQSKNGRRSKGAGDFPPQHPQQQNGPNQVIPVVPLQGAHPTAQQLRQHQQQLQAQQPRPPPPPMIKFPIEDLDVAPKRNGVTRPQLKFFTPEMSEYIESKRRTTFDGIDMDSLGMLLEVWNTLNVQCEVYIIDSFTFDDFVDAMQYSEPAPECELLNEAHCAVLKLLVDENGKGIAKSGLPDLPVPEESSSEGEDSEESSLQPDAPAHSTRSRLSHIDPHTETPRTLTLDKLHRAAEIAGGEYGWKERVLARDMEDGGWQMILAGVLYQLSLSPVFKKRCEKVLSELVPLDMEPTTENIRDQYRTLNVNLRISALQMITVLSLASEPIRNFLDACADDMTDVRKRKVEYQREKKAAFEEWQAKDRERKVLLPANMPDSPALTTKAESIGPDSIISEMDDTIDVSGAVENSDGDDGAPGRALRRGNDRKRKREEEAARREKIKAEKAEAMKAQSKQTKEFRKLVSDIQKLTDKIAELEDKINDCDSDLREANVQRTRMLGMDRFFNRYYWYERNGQPFGGLPSSSTASYGYANGRIWVQGPDPLEIGPYADDEEFQKDYHKYFHMTINERRKAEEGLTILKDCTEWGFYDDPDRLDNLIGWLDDRGHRERKLRKELIEWRDMIAKYMTAYKDFLAAEEAKKVESDEEQPTRITTRHQMAVDQIEARERCLKWRNTMALEHEELGHLHSQAPPQKKQKRKAPKGTAVLVNRQGKPLTRQGNSHK